MDKSYRETYKITQWAYWKNLWFYNKKIIFAVVAALAICIYGIVSCTSTERADVQILVVTREGISSEKAEKLSKQYSGMIDDLNDDGKRVVQFVTVNIPENTVEEVDAANRTRLNTEMLNGDSILVIAETELIERYFEDENFFDELEQGKYESIKSKNGKKAAVDISTSKIASELGFRGDGLCLLIKHIDENSPVYEQYLQSKKIAREISEN